MWIVALLLAGFTAAPVLRFRGIWEVTQAWVSEPPQRLLRQRLQFGFVAGARRV